eukprot:CAMPEP_0181236936 /NCGR_PEP_ID=MMETSP1096-20121128/38468_1 /TAXON_ID=156174 ORGANISM="Chrysochromulina ericina, Strain CCMP281" /NCGR_SAMPLE_ID=MMETSP1096 /ASSEMBLY_ACC=CAM_ASM_000453 /LENGTH=161 /DNA_ID=CAMNT_0023332203 /DNA_START=204 /DNA_END=687 /DNA_ORIENTATION=-
MTAGMAAFVEGQSEALASRASVRCGVERKVAVAFATSALIVEGLALGPSGSSMGGIFQRRGGRWVVYVYVAYLTGAGECLELVTQEVTVLPRAKPIELRLHELQHRSARLGAGQWHLPSSQAGDAKPSRLGNAALPIGKHTLHQVAVIFALTRARVELAVL